MAEAGERAQTGERAQRDFAGWRAQTGERAQRDFAGWRAQTGERAQRDFAGWRAQTGERAQRDFAGWRAQAATTDQEMYGLGHELHHFVDLREFPEDTHAQYMSLHKTKQSFSFETGNTMQYTFTCTC